MNLAQAILLAISAVAAAWASYTAARSATEAREEREKQAMSAAYRNTVRNVERIVEALAELGQLRATMGSTVSVAATNAMVAYPLAQKRLEVALSATFVKPLTFPECQRVAVTPIGQGAVPVEAALGEIADAYQRLHEASEEHDKELRARRERRLEARVRRALRR